MSKNPQDFKSFSKSLMEKMGKDIERWSQDSNPIIAAAFKDCIEAAK